MRANLFVVDLAGGRQIERLHADRRLFQGVILGLMWLHFLSVNMIGAVVGVQPFGGEGLSGTGPKAGGPHYLYRFRAEQTLTVNTTAAGGNAALLAG